MIKWFQILIVPLQLVIKMYMNIIWSLKLEVHLTLYIVVVNSDTYRVFELFELSSSLSSDGNRTN